MLKKIIACTRKRTYEQRVRNLIPDRFHPAKDPYSSDSDERFVKIDLKKVDSLPVIRTGQGISSDLMTIPSISGDQPIPIKGNQLIFWSRKLVDHLSAHALDPSQCPLAVKGAVDAKTAAIKSPSDWLRYEGMFDSFARRPARITPTFRGVVSIFLKDDVKTTVEFKNKVSRKQVNGQWVSQPTDILYAHIHDPGLIQFLRDDLGQAKYRFPDNYGLSYPEIVRIVELVKTKFTKTDAELAQRQLLVLHGGLEQVNVTDPFWAFLNAVLFGAEASRNSLSFATGVMTLDLISRGRMTYDQAFKSPDYNDMESAKEVNLAVYPMTSPYTGSGNFLGYLALMEATAKENETEALKSEIGMKLQREYPQWAQIPLKEALLIRYWLCETGLFADRRADNDTVRMCCAIQRGVSRLVSHHFGVPELTPIPTGEFEDLISLGIDRRIHRGLLDGRALAVSHRQGRQLPIAETPCLKLSEARLETLKKQAAETQNELNMVYVTDGEEYLLISSYAKMRKMAMNYMMDEMAERGERIPDELMFGVNLLDPVMMEACHQWPRNVFSFP